MRYNQLGRTGLYVSQICLGTMTFAGKDAPVVSRLFVWIDDLHRTDGLTITLGDQIVTFQS